MKLKIGTEVTAMTVSGIKVTGEVLKLLDNTTIISCGVEKYIVRNEELKKQGHII